jgi:transcriptional regulator of nitric oxide reductase
VGRVGAMEISPLSGSTVTLSAKNDEIIEKTLSSKKSKYYH